METSSITVEIALISGLMARRMRPKTSMGRVVPPGPVVKKVMTKSSRESVKASNAPAQNAQHDQRQGHPAEGDPLIGTQILGRFLQAGVNYPDWCAQQSPHTRY